MKKQYIILLLIAVMMVFAGGCTSAEQLQGMKDTAAEVDAQIVEIKAALVDAQVKLEKQPGNKELIKQITAGNELLAKLIPIADKWHTDIDKVEAGGNGAALEGWAVTIGTLGGALPAPFNGIAVIIASLLAARGKIVSNKKQLETEAAESREYTANEKAVLMEAKYTAHKRGVNKVLKEPDINATNVESKLYAAIGEERSRAGI